jgi:protein TonB
LAVAVPGHRSSDRAGAGTEDAGTASGSAPQLAAVPGVGGAGAGAGGGADGDLRPLCVSCPAPEYPARARRRGWQGTVEVGLAIGRDGRVRDVRVARSSGFGALDTAAVAVARRSRFVLPGRGAAVRGKLRYRFRLEGPL